MSTKQDLTAKLHEWEKLKTRATKIETQREQQLQTILDVFEKKAEPINADADRQLAPLVDQMEAIEKELESELLGSIKPDGSIRIPQLETASALAQVMTDSRREIKAAAFFRAVLPSRRNDPDFYGCLSVLIGKAEKFLDKATMTRLARAKLTHSVSLTLKS